MPTVNRPLLLLLVAMITAALVYLPGLRGPFLHDDIFGLAVVQKYMLGEASLWEAIFGNGGWATRRSLAMASFVANAALTGLSPLALKSTNLAIHIACGLLVFVFIAQLSRRANDGHLRLTLAAVVAAAWLLHPYNLSTVLYPIQRMTQLATLAVLLGLSLYIYLRIKLESGRPASLWLGIYGIITILTFAGVQGKQNAAILPLLCLIVEHFYFTPFRRWKLPQISFALLFVGLPTLVVAILLIVSPEVILAGYIEYSFSVWERLLTAPRVLLTYMGQTIIPHTPSMGVYTDDYFQSTSLFSPPVTLSSLVALLGITFFLLKTKTLPHSIKFGWLFFLAAHSIEAGFLPLELYYEHRNYLPAIGLLIAVVSLIDFVLKRLTLTRPLVPAAVTLLILFVLTGATLGRSLVWRHQDTIATQAFNNRPDSLRAGLAYVAHAWMADDQRQVDVAIRRLKTNPDAQVRSVSNLMEIQIQCMRTGMVEATTMRSAIEHTSGRVDLRVVYMLNHLLTFTSQNRCQGFSDVDLGRLTERIADNARNQPDTYFGKWNIRYVSMRAYAREGMWSDAARVGRKAWQPNADLAVGEILARALVFTGNVEEAEQVYNEMSQKLDPRRVGDLRGLEALREFLDSHESGREINQ